MRFSESLIFSKSFQKQEESREVRRGGQHKKLGGRGLDYRIALTRLGKPKCFYFSPGELFLLVRREPPVQIKSTQHPLIIRALSASLRDVIRKEHFVFRTEWGTPFNMGCRAFELRTFEN
ncbi:hypothetical protein CEXT_147241 [Caerostris extrusa]|uniref:Uncharacterized protein n=1 Tax=Caerostris extrusa TaxID=172846 RepID=A0AAV4SUI9_CAEEX|nr:hypothetical protein CEXT_147241 [Caerostris extrusa]